MAFESEEFWYTNVPGTDAPPGVCAGGSYREILVYVDGMLAGACFPFPVIYSGQASVSFCTCMAIAEQVLLGGFRTNGQPPFLLSGSPVATGQQF